MSEHRYLAAIPSKMIDTVTSYLDDIDMPYELIENDELPNHPEVPLPRANRYARDFLIYDYENEINARDTKPCIIECNMTHCELLFGVGHTFRKKIWRTVKDKSNIPQDSIAEPENDIPQWAKTFAMPVGPLTPYERKMLS